MDDLERLEEGSLRGMLEAMLLVTTDPVPATELAKVLSVTPGEVAEALAAGLTFGDIVNGSVLLNQAQIDAAQAAGFKVYTPRYSEKKFHLAVDPAQPLPEHVKTLVIAGEVKVITDNWMDPLTKSTWARVSDTAIRQNQDVFARAQGNKLGRKLVFVWPSPAAADQSDPDNRTVTYSWETTTDPTFWLKDAAGNPIDDNGAAAKAEAESWIAKQADPGAWDIIVFPAMPGPPV